MENDDVNREALANLDRAAATPYLTYPPLPRWYPLAGGAWFTALLTLSRLTGTINTGITLGCTAVLLAALGACVGWYTRARGVTVSAEPRYAPREIARAMYGYYLGAIVAIGIIAACWIVGPWWWTTLATFALTTGGLALYERAYAVAARAVQARLDGGSA